MAPSPSRRRLLQASGAGAIFAIAGCVQSGLDGAQPEDEEPGSSTEQESDQPDDEDPDPTTGEKKKKEDYIDVKDVYATKGGGYLNFTVVNNNDKTLRQLSLESRDANAYGISVHDIRANSSVEFTLPISHDVSGGEKDIDIFKPLFEGNVKDYTSNTWEMNASVSNYSSLYEDVELTFPLPDDLSVSDAKSVSIFEHTLGEEFGSEMHKGVGDSISWTVGRFYSISEYDVEVDTLEGTREYTVGPPEVQADFDLVDVSASETKSGMRIDSVTIDIKSDKIYNGGISLTRDKRSSAKLGEESATYPPTRAVEPVKEPARGEQTIDIADGAHFSAPLNDGQRLRIHLLEGGIPFSVTTSDEVLSYL